MFDTNFVAKKIKEARVSKNMTQMDLADAMGVSFQAVSNWERGRGYPNIDSLKAISRYFSVSLDELLSGEEILTIAEDENRKKEKHIRDLVFGLLDCSVAIFLFLPLFGQRVGNVIQEVSLLALTEEESYVRVPCLILVFGLILWGILTLALQNCEALFWLKCKDKVSLGLSAVGAFFFMLSRQPYGAAFTFLFLIIKALMLIKWT